MITYLFIWVLYLSLIGCVGAILVWLADLLLKDKLNASLRYYIWIPVLLLMILPVQGTVAELPRNLYESHKIVVQSDFQTGLNEAAGEDAAPAGGNGEKTGAVQAVETRSAQQEAQTETASLAPENPKDRVIKDHFRIRLPLHMELIDILACIWAAGLLLFLLKLAIERVTVFARLYQISIEARADQKESLEKVKKINGDSQTHWNPSDEMRYVAVYYRDLF